MKMNALVTLMTVIIAANKGIHISSTFIVLEKINGLAKYCYSTFY